MFPAGFNACIATLAGGIIGDESQLPDLAGYPDNQHRGVSVRLDRV